MNAAQAKSSEDASDADHELLAPEMVARLARLAITARKLAAARRAGRRRTRRVGSGVETIDLRPYAVGDDPRRIAWHAYARLEKLLVRLVADEAPQRLALIVDQSASMGFGRPSKLRHAARVAAGLAAVGLAGEDRVAVAVGAGGDARALRAVSGRGGLGRVLSTLDRLAAIGTTDLPRTVRAAVDAAGGRGLAIIVSDLYEPEGVLAGAREARLRGHDVAIVEVLAPFEVDPGGGIPLDGLELEDEETGEIVELPARFARERYVEALSAHRRTVDVAAAELGAVVLRTTTDETFEAVVTRALGQGWVRA